MMAEGVSFNRSLKALSLNKKRIIIIRRFSNNQMMVFC